MIVVTGIILGTFVAVSEITITTKTTIMKFSRILTAILILPFIAFQSCDKDDNDVDGRAIMNIRMVDAPAAYDSVMIDVQSVRVHVDSAWYEYLVIDPGTHDLLALSNGNSLILVDDDEVPAGELTEMRLILGDNNYIVSDGMAHDLTTPSAHSSGYKIKIHEMMQAGNVYEVIIDFDANRSIHMTGNGKYMLRPVVHGYLVDAIGQISGEVEPSDAAYYAMAYNSSDTSGTNIDQGTGEFLISTVVAGEYTVEILANPGYQDTLIYNVEVESGLTTDLGLIEF